MVSLFLEIARMYPFLNVIECEVRRKSSIFGLLVRTATAVCCQGGLGPAVSDRPAQLPNIGVTAASAIITFLFFPFIVQGQL